MQGRHALEGRAGRLLEPRRHRHEVDREVGVEGGDERREGRREGDEVRRRPTQGEKSDAKMRRSRRRRTKAAAKADGRKAEEKDAKGATAVCKDNTYSHAKNRQGMCSGHGGVAKMMGK